MHYGRDRWTGAISRTGSASRGRRFTATSGRSGTRGARVRIAPRPVPIILTIADEQVIVGAVDDVGSPRGLLVTDDEEVRAWAEAAVDDSLARAEALTPGAIEAAAVATDGGA